MSLSGQELGRVVERWQSELVGAVVRKVISPVQPDRVALELRQPGANHYAQFVVEPRFARIARIDRKPPNAPVPHPFVMLLRGRITGARLLHTEQLAGDRVAKLVFGHSDGTTFDLVVELIGRHSNLYFTNAAQEIVAAFRPNSDTRRELSAGARYVPPPAQTNTAAPRDRFPAGDDLEVAIEAAYAGNESSTDLHSRRSSLLRALRRACKQRQRLLAKLQQDEARASRSEEQEHHGHLLKTYLHQVRKGMTEIEVCDFEGTPVTVPLDPKKSPVENMKSLFDSARRFRQAAARIVERRENVEMELLELEELIEQVTVAEEEELQAMTEALQQRFPRVASEQGPGRSQQAQRLPYREYDIADGARARVGRNARDNDELTLRHCKPDDLWLHARGRTGSHVTVPLGRHQSPPPELLVDAAHLAAHFSDAQGEEDVEVIYTPRRYVQKPRGAAPGSVRLLQEKTIYVRIEPDRLERILANRLR